MAPCLTAAARLPPYVPLGCFALNSLPQIRYPFRRRFFSFAIVKQAAILGAMNIKSLRFSIYTMVLALFLIAGLNSRAQSAPATPSVASTTSINQLTQAYTALSIADHDYQGHRVRAMKQIEAAAKVVGVILGGNGKGHEQQVTSDQQLQTATGLLQQARAGLPTKAQKHVDKALEQLATALSIK